MFLKTVMERNQPLVRLGIGQKAAASMVDSVLDSRKKATEEPEAQTWEMLLDELTDDDADLFSTKDLLEAIQRGTRRKRTICWDG